MGQERENRWTFPTFSLLPPTPPGMLVFTFCAQIFKLPLAGSQLFRKSLCLSGQLQNNGISALRRLIALSMGFRQFCHHLLNLRVAVFHNVTQMHYLALELFHQRPVYLRVIMRVIGHAIRID